MITHHIGMNAVHIPIAKVMLAGCYGCSPSNFNRVN
jgi:hypothetical protein